MAVLALAREVGILRMAMQSGGALEIPEEGPALGARSRSADGSSTAGLELGARRVRLRRLPDVPQPRPVD